MKRINASEFKAKCLAILDEVNATGEVVVIEKRGKPVAQLTSYTPLDAAIPQQTLLGTVRILGNIEEPVIDADEWAAMKKLK